MTQEEKDLLLQELCARLPYGVKAYVKNWRNFKTYEDIYVVKSVFPSLNEVHVQSELGSHDVILGYYDYEFKPYLFPMSSITEEQVYKFYCRFVQNDILFEDFLSDYWYANSFHKILTSIDDCYDVITFFYENHIDFRGLIDKNLALDATVKNIY